MFIWHLNHAIVFEIWDIHFLLSTCLVLFVSLFLFREGQLEIVRFLVDGGHHQPNSKDNVGRTALHYAAEYVHQSVYYSLADNYV